MNPHAYVHGYSPRENRRLSEQSEILKQILHGDTHFEPASLVLEAGCGTGAQSAILSPMFPETVFMGIDISLASLAEARSRGLHRHHFSRTDINCLPFPPETFDHVLVCFVLEHLTDPEKALYELKRVLKPRGLITVIEGDHGSCFWHPETRASRTVWQSLITVQSGLGHDPDIGRRLHPLLSRAGFHVQMTRPCWLYADASCPDLLDGMVNKIIVPMVKTARESAIQQGLAGEAEWAEGIADLEKSGNPPGGTFFYTWFKSIGVKQD
ncbi:methyltransferase domain-containing protein [bacterium]|nr:methyltransferase domain-containing protein [bacterium]